MRVIHRTISATIAAVALFAATASHSGDVRGNFSSQLNLFFSDNTANDWRSSASFAADIEFYQQMADDISLTMRPFMRWDQRDENRTHADLREFILTTNGDGWEFSGGLGQVFWGVTESRNPVDVINQTDNLEGAGTSDKLGQLMLSFKWFNDYGDFELFALPHFRTRSFSGIDGRPFAGFTVAESDAQFESSEGVKHVDAAMRWSRSFDSWDLGLHYFAGTSRAPALIPVSATQLVPRYRQIQQTGLDALGIYGDTNIKAEIIYLKGDEITDHTEAVVGLEHTVVGLLAPLQDNDVLPADWCDSETANPVTALLCNDRLDLGLILEYLWDERGTDASQSFQNDLLAGLRFAFNDERSSDALIGLIRDLDHNSTSLSLEASTRLFNSFRLSSELRLFSGTSDDPFLRALAKEDYLRVDLGYFF